MEGDLTQARLKSPSKSDIQGSKALLDVKRMLTQYKEASTPALKKEKFMSFAVFLLDFLISDSGQSIEKNIPLFVNEVTKYVKLNEMKVSELVIVLRVLQQAHHMFSITIAREILSRLFSDVIREGCECDSVFELGREFFRAIFDNKKVFQKFTDNNRIWVYFRNVFCEMDNEDAGVFITETLIDEKKSDFYDAFPFHEFCKSFRETVDENAFKSCMIPLALSFIARLTVCVSLNSKDILGYLESSGTLAKIDELVRSVEDVNQRCCLYRYFLMCHSDDGSKPVNAAMLQYLYHLAETDHALEAAIFDLIVDLVVENEDLIDVINSAVPFASWFTLENIRVEQFTRLFEVINVKAPEFVVVSLQLYFEAIKRQEISVSELERCLMIVRRQRELKMVTPSHLLNCDFLRVFFLHQPLESVGKIVSDPSMLQMLSEIGSLDMARESVCEVFPVILRAVEYVTCNDMFVATLTLLLTHFPESAMFHCLLRGFRDTPTVLTVLEHVFVAGNVAASANFVAVGGAKWLLEQDHDIEIVCEVLASIVSTGNFEEIEEAIAGLPETHPLFSIKQQWMENIVFGRNGARYRKVRVFSLLPFLEQSYPSDSYSAYLIGSKYMDYLLERVKDIRKIPMLKEVANRFVQPKHVPLFLSKSQSLCEFCDPLSDHFPLFQIYPGRDQLVFRIDCSSVSFWFKYSESISSSGVFFESGSLTLSFAHDRLVVKTDRQLFPVQIESSSWNFIGINSGSDATISVNSDVFHLTSVSSFSSVVFSAGCNALLSLGAAIRFFTTETDFSELYSLGPSSMKNYNEMCVNPFSFLGDSHTVNCTKPENCVAAPYYGLPMHLSHESAYHSLFLIMKHSPTTCRTMFRPLLSVAKIVRINNVRFWYELFGSMKSAKKIETYLDCFKVIATFDNRVEILETVLFNESMWKKLSHSALLNDLFALFPASELVLVRNFQIWLVDLLTKTGESKHLVKLLVEHTKELPDLAKYLRTVLRVGFQFPEKQETSIQFEIVETLIECRNKKLVNGIVSFEDLKSLISVSSPEFRFKLFRLLLHMAEEDRDYLRNAHELVVELVPIVKFTEFWNELLRVSLKSMSKPRVDLFPFLLMLICCGSICVLHANFYALDMIDKLSDIETLLQRTVKLFNHWMKHVVEDSNSVHVIKTWYPLLFHYPALFENVDRPLKTQKIQCTPISQDDYPDVFDGIWRDLDYVLKRKESLLNESFTVEDPRDFLLRIIRDLLSGFDSSLKFESSSDVNWANLSLILGFLTDVLVILDENTMRQLAHELFHSYFFGKSQLAQKLSPMLMHLLLEKIPYVFSSSFPLQLILDHCYILGGRQWLMRSSLAIIPDLFHLYSILKGKLARKQLASVASDVHSLILVLFSEAPASSTVLISLLSQNVDIFASLVAAQKSLYSWIYAFSKLPGETDPQVFGGFCSKLKRVLKINSSDSAILDQILTKQIPDKALAKLEESWKAKDKEFHLKYAEIHKQMTSVVSSDQHESVSILEIKQKMNHKTKLSHSLLSNLLMNSLRLLNHDLELKEEQIQWSVLNHLMKNPDNYERLCVSQKRARPRKSSEGADEADHHAPSRSVMASKSLGDLVIFPEEQKEVPLLRPVPFCWPFYCPRLFANSPFKLPGLQSLVKLHALCEKNFETNLLSLFLKSHVEYGTLKEHLNCDLIRYGRVIPSTLLLFRDVFVVVAGTSVVTEDGVEDFKFECVSDDVWEFFIESVLLNHWGETSIFASRIVIVVRFESIVFSQTIFARTHSIWSLANGHFLLNLTSDSKLLSSTLEAVSGNSVYDIPDKFLFQLRNLSDVHSAWQEPWISATDVILWLNGLSGRSFVDFSHYPVFPIPFLHGIPLIQREDVSNLIPSLFLFNQTGIEKNSWQVQDVPGDLYFNSFGHDEPNVPFQRRESLETSTMDELSRWAKQRFDVSLSLPHRTRSLDIGNLDYSHVSQRLNLTLDNSSSLFYYDDSIATVPGNALPLPTIPFTAIAYQIEYAAISVINYADLTTNQKIYDPLYSFITSIHVSSDGIFFVVDLSVGLTFCFRIEYNHKSVRCITKASEFLSPGKPRSVVLGRDFVVATFTGNVITLWNIFGATTHRKITCDSPITSLTVDSELGCFIVTTVTNGIIVNLNGETLVSLDVSGAKITAVATFELPLSSMSRATILGGDDGSVWLMSPRYDLRTAEIKRLKPAHNAPIRAFVIHSSKRAFLSVDTAGVINVWTANGLPPANPIKLDLFASCAFCERRPTSHCINCSRGVCDACMSESHGICNFCTW